MGSLFVIKCHVFIDRRSEFTFGAVFCSIELLSFQQFFEIIEEKAARLKPVADELTEAMREGYAELIIRCFDVNGEKLLDYTVGRLFTLGES